MIPLLRCSAAGSFLLYNLSIRGIARDADAPPAVKPVIQNQPHRKFHQRRNRRGIALRRFALDGENSIILVTLAQVSQDGGRYSSGCWLPPHLSPCGQVSVQARCQGYHHRQFRRGSHPLRSGQTRLGDIPCRQATSRVLPAVPVAPSNKTFFILPPPYHVSENSTNSGVSVFPMSGSFLSSAESCAISVLQTCICIRAAAMLSWL